MHNPDDISMERLLEPAPLHTHPSDDEQASETGSFLDPMMKQNSGEQLPSLCSQGCS